MVKLTNKKRKWAIDNIILGKKTVKEIAEIYNVSNRWIQILVRNYKKTGEYPVLSRMRRPKIELSEENKELIDKAVKETGLVSTVHLHLYIQKHYNKKLPYNKIHRHLIKKELSKEDDKKKKQRKHCIYERDHSFSLTHLDWHESKVIKDKQVCVVLDDASRKVICGDEFSSVTGENAINLMKQAIKIAWKEYSTIIKECNTDKGPQFTAIKTIVREIGEKQSLNYSLKNKELITFFQGETIHKQMEKMKDGLEPMKNIGEDSRHLRNSLIGITIKFI